MADQSLILEDEMLAQILHDLHVPRELLDGLPEDQKQLLFCKMREEQIRRYHEREEDEEARIATTVNTKKKKKQVTFRLGADGQEWCWVMDESDLASKNTNNRTNNENIEIDHPNQLRPTAGVNYTPPTKNESYYTAHRDERKQIEEISNNIQEARRIFERLESDTRQLVLDKESEVLQQQQQQRSLPNDVVDELFYHELEERAKKADRERRETARRARDNFQRNSLQLNVCFDTDNHATILFQPPPLNFSNKTTKEKNIQIELVDTKRPATPNSPVHERKIKEEQSPLKIVENYRSQPLLPLTREDIRQWFCTVEIPYSTFRASNGQLYPWFHGIISRAYTEQILNSKPIGSYLIRINEKIFGYALSYRASDHCRHLLIEVILSPKRDEKQDQHTYRFLGGAKYELFTQLNQLIEKYSNTPIRVNSTDVLRCPCGQIDPQKPDYADLFIENDKQYEPLYISLETTTSSPQSTTHL